MAALVTLATMRDRARRRANMENSTFVTDAELTDEINQYVTEVYDMLVAAAPPGYYAATSTITVVAGTVAYALPTDFRSLQLALVEEINGRQRELHPLDGSREQYVTPRTDGTVTLRYTPAPPVLVDDTDTFDGISGWEQLIVLMAARYCLAKEESDVSSLFAEISAMQKRISMRAPARDQGAPAYVKDTYATRRGGWPNVLSAVVYELRGGYIDLYARDLTWP